MFEVNYNNLLANCFQDELYKYQKGTSSTVISNLFMHWLAQTAMSNLVNSSPISFRRVAAARNPSITQV